MTQQDVLIVECSLFALCNKTHGFQVVSLCDSSVHTILSQKSWRSLRYFSANINTSLCVLLGQQWYLPCNSPTDAISFPQSNIKMIFVWNMRETQICKNRRNRRKGQILFHITVCNLVLKREVWTLMSSSMPVGIVGQVFIMYGKCINVYVVKMYKIMTTESYAISHY